MANWIQYWPVIVCLLMGFTQDVFAQDATTSELHRVAGIVLSPDGQPLAGLPIQLLCQDQQQQGGIQLKSDGTLIPSWPSVAETVTDVAGRFQLEITTASSLAMVRVAVPDCPVVFSGIRFFKPNAGQVTPYSNLTLQSSRGVPARIRVLDINQLPVGGAVIHRMSAGPSMQGVKSYVFPQAETVVAETDAEGNASLQITPDESQYVWLEKKGYIGQQILLGPAETQAMGGWTLTGLDERTIRGPQDPIEFIIHPAQEWGGRIVDEFTKQPVAGADVFVSIDLSVPESRASLIKGAMIYPMIRTTSDMNGRFLVPELPQAPLKLCAYKEDRFATRQSANSPLEDDILLGKGEVVHGQVLDFETGLPVSMADGKVRLEVMWGPEFLGSVQDNGHFEVKVPESMTFFTHFVPHPLWVEQRQNSMSATSHQSVMLYVQRRPDPLTDLQVVTELQEFPKDYRLEEHDVLRRISRPFPRSREAFFQTGRLVNFVEPEWMLESARGHLRAMDGDGVGTSPNGAVFVVDSKNRFRVDSSHHGQLPIQQVLSSFAPDLSFRRVRMNPILYGNPPKLYDFIIRERTPLNELVEALNLSFQQNPTIPIEVSLVEEKFTTLVVHNQPQSTTFSREMRLRLVPDGYEGPTEITTRHGTWSRMIDLVAQHSLEVEWKLDAPSSPTMGILTVEVPKALKNATNQFDQAQRMAELQAKSEMLAKMRLLAPKAFKEQLGVVVEVREIPLPVVQIEPLQVVAPASVPAVPLKPEKSR